MPGRIASAFCFMFIMFASPSYSPLAETPDETPKTAEFLMDDVEKIYVVDEATCSIKRPSCESGKTYIIEGEEKLGLLRDGLTKMDTSTRGGCLCGGPDIHFYCLLQDGSQRYLGLDCNNYLAGIQITDEVRSLINPVEGSFLGTFFGYALVADAPTDLNVEDFYSLCQDTGTVGLATEWNRERALEREREAIAPVHLRLETNFHAEDIANFEEKSQLRWQWEKDAAKRFENWLSQRGLTEMVLKAGRVSSPRSSGSRTRESMDFQQDVYLSDPAAAKGILSKGDDPEQAVTLKDVEYRSAEQQSEPHFYTVILISNNPCSAKEIGGVDESFPMLERIRPICDRRMIH